MLISARRLVILYISTKFCEIITNGIRYRVDTISSLKITKENNTAKNAGGATVVNLCMSSGNVLHSAKFRVIISNGIKVTEQTQFQY